MDPGASNRPDPDDAPVSSEPSRPSVVSTPVPDEQIPMNEFEEFLELATMSWPTKGATDYGLRLLALYAASMAFIALPVSVETYPVSVYPVQAVLAASAGSLAFVTVAVLRIYSGWSQISNRLLSASIEYEESSWADGGVWVKPDEMKQQDRLVAQEKCIPALELIKGSLMGLTAGLAVALLLLYSLPQPLRVTRDDPFKPPTVGGYSQEMVDRMWETQTTRQSYQEMIRLYEPWALVDDMTPEEQEEARNKYYAGEGFDYKRWGVEPPASMQGEEEGE